MLWNPIKKNVNWTLRCLHLSRVMKFRKLNSWHRPFALEELFPCIKWNLNCKFVSEFITHFECICRGWELERKSNLIISFVKQNGSYPSIEREEVHITGTLGLMEKPTFKNVVGGFQFCKQILLF